MISDFHFHSIDFLSKLMVAVSNVNPVDEKKMCWVFKIVLLSHIGHIGTARYGSAHLIVNCDRFMT